jgi:uncharacterized protein with HEPN domain
MRSDQERLLDIEEAIAKIERYSVRGKSEFMENELIQFRNLLVHEYFRVDLKLVWSIVEQQLPILKAQIARISGGGL